MRGIPSPSRQEAGSQHFRFALILKGIMVSLLFSLCGCIIVGTVMFATDLTFSRLPAIAPDLLIILSVIGGALYSARRAAGSGWLHGGMTGLGYVLVTVLSGYLLDGGADIPVVMSRVILGFVIGSISGVIAVNLD